MSHKSETDWSHFPSLHPATEEALDAISQARYPRDVKKIARRAGLLVGKHHIPLVEMDAILLAGAHKARALTPHDPAEPLEVPVIDSNLGEVVELPNVTPAQPQVPVERELDWRERQLPVGDR